MKFLIIQPAFIGDVVLATSLIETIVKSDSSHQIDFLLRKGNEGLLKEHPHIEKLYILDRKKSKFAEIIRLLKGIRKERYDYVINPHRFASSGIISALSKGAYKVGFDKNPFAFFYQKKVKHSLAEGKHEIERNHELIAELVQTEKAEMPKLFPSQKDFEKLPSEKYICIAPASVWFTKQYPQSGWLKLINKTDKDKEVHLIGGPGDLELCEQIAKQSDHPKIKNRAGQLNFLQSAALISRAEMTYTNDSAPMHFASAMNAPITALFCSTLPSFGFGPLSDQSQIAQSQEKLSCRPCGIHGKKECPEGHFKCGAFEL